MIRYIAVFTFLVIVGVCSYVVLNPGSYSTPVLCLANFVLCVAPCAIAPVWKVILVLYNKNPANEMEPRVNPACSETPPGRRKAPIRKTVLASRAARLILVLFQCSNTQRR
jgi:hypothetical protein